MLALALGVTPEDEPRIIATIIIDGEAMPGQDITAQIMTLVASKVLKQGGKAYGTMVETSKSQSVVAGQRIKFTASKIEGLH